MNKTKKIILSSVLAAIMLAISILFCLQAFPFSGSNALTKGTYNDSFTVLAEGEDPQAVAELGETKYMCSVGKDYLLFATALHIENTNEYTEVGYIITEGGESVDADLSSEFYYTGITVQTATQPKTWKMSEIFAEDGETMGMVVAEIEYNSAYEYTVQAYTMKRGVDTPILGTKYTVAVYGNYALNLMSFNIRTIAGDDTGVKNWSSRKTAVIEFINNSEADIIGLQEVKQTQFNDIDAGLASNYGAIYYPRETTTNPEGLALVYDKTEFNVISQERYWLSETPDAQSKGWGESYYRIAVEILLQHKATGEYVKTVNTHGPLNGTANTNGYNLIANRSLKGDYFTFLCGDFNARPGQLGYVPIAEKLQDCRVTAEDSSTRDDATFNAWGTESTTSPPRIIDYCFVSKSENVKVLTYEVRTDKWGTNNANFLSDHYAVQTTVKVKYRLQGSIKFPSTTQNGFDGELDTNLNGGTND